MTVKAAITHISMQLSPVRGKLAISSWQRDGCRAGFADIDAYMLRWTARVATACCNLPPFIAAGSQL
ncbi:hypothetical protein Y1Q_0023865 [Alligator mississippiensis]|uniref:Uncharacterized protein n=1 Tax=Alligator mississippiensis TaxID=8496 RepID=A0A151MKH7_ALLMI|nr:hypothetical protein Y1Q_0023865 [Alligator mississippiensis]